MKPSRLILTVFAAVLMASAVASCDKEDTTQDIDPCPGWPAFKVGNEWHYYQNSNPMDIYWYADSVVKLFDTYYLRIQVTEVNLNLDTIGRYNIYFRTENDTLITATETNEWTHCIFNMPIGDSINIYTVDSQGKQIYLFKLKSISINISYKFNNDYYEGCYKFAADYDHDLVWNTIISKEIGIIIIEHIGVNDFQTLLCQVVQISGSRSTSIAVFAPQAAVVSEAKCNVLHQTQILSHQSY